MVYLSSSCFQSDDICNAVEKASCITKNVELSGGTTYRENSLVELEKLKETYNFLVHSYFPPPKEHFILNFTDVTSVTRDFIDRSMEYVEALNVPYYSIHAGFRRPLTTAENLELNAGDYSFENFLENVEWFSKRYPNAKLIFENLYPIRGLRDACYAMHIDEIIYFLKSESRIGLLLDFGHLKVSSRILGFNYLEAVRLLFEEYGDRIVELHLSENDGDKDDHKAIYSDSVQYFIVNKYAEIIRKNKINVVIETRDQTPEVLGNIYNLIQSSIGEETYNEL